MSEQFHIVSFNAEQFSSQLSRIQTSFRSPKPDESLLRKELMSNVNFARNFADDILLPFGVEKMMYLDVDTIVQGDIVRLIADTNLTGSKFFAAVASCKQHMEQWFDFSSSLVRRTMKRRDCYINAGVYIVHLPMYREAAIQARILQLIGAHQRHRLWLQGVHQPSFVLALYNYTMLLDRRWNVAGLGWISNMDEALLKSAHVLHWSGAHKPWQCDGFYRSYWDPYGVPPKNCPAQPYPGAPRCR
uniref:Hexosyltransferase n=1 Tax=Tetraselmis sp. GSL018 TaxID=582737 RepID=A0A061QIL7_9CHLO